MKRTFLAIVSLAALALAALPGTVWADTVGSSTAAPVLASSTHGGPGGGPGGGGPGPGGGGGGPFPPVPPYVSASCQGPNNDGTVYPSQVDACTLSSSEILHSGNRLIAIPAEPTGGESIKGCAGSAGLTAGTENYEKGGDPISCSFTVLTGMTVLPGQVVGSLRFTIDPFTSAGSVVRIGVNGCSDGPGSPCGGTVDIDASGPGGVVSSDPPFTVSANDIAATEGQLFSGPVGSINDADPTASPSEYAVDIVWGDGTDTVATLDGWSVVGSHIYTEEGTYPVMVSVTDRDLDHLERAYSTAFVADAPIHGQGKSIIGVNPVGANLATFSDADPNGVPSDYTATVDWGDGSNPFTATVSQDGAAFVVSGSHAYAALGPYTVSLHVCDVGGACTDVSSSVLVYEPTAGGSFVIGDGNAATGSSATFWGSQWANANALSGGAAPAQFKGFADNPNGLPACGDSWSTSPGNSAQPPDTVPSYTAMIVSSAVTSDSAHVSGQVGQIVIVKTDPGYAPDPGHPGTATIVAVLC